MEVDLKRCSNHEGYFNSYTHYVACGILSGYVQGGNFPRVGLFQLFNFTNHQDLIVINVFSKHLSVQFLQMATDL